MQADVILKERPPSYAPGSIALIITEKNSSFEHIF